MLLKMILLNVIFLFHLSFKEGTQVNEYTFK